MRSEGIQKRRLAEQDLKYANARNSQGLICAIHGLYANGNGKQNTKGASCDQLAEEVVLVQHANLRPSNLKSKHWTGTASISRAKCMYDVIIISTEDDDEHTAYGREVLTSLKDKSLKAKCKFFKEEIEYCAHSIRSDGLHETDKNICTVVNVSCPENVTQMCSFFGMVNYYKRFLRNWTIVLHSLCRVLHKNRKWYWNRNCEVVFNQSINQSINQTSIAPINPEKPGWVVRQPNQCSTVKSRKQFRKSKDYDSLRTGPEALWPWLALLHSHVMPQPMG